MTDSWKTRVLAAATALAVGCGGSSVDPSTVSLTGTWSGAPGQLGIATMNLTIIESTGDLSGSGTYIGTSGVLANGTVTLIGIHLAGEVNMTMHLIPEGAAELVQNITGHIEDENHFVLVFPGNDQPSQVTFTRQ